MKISIKDLRSDDLKNTQWVGRIEDTNDELFEGRCKIRVFGKMDQRIDPSDSSSEYVLPIDVLPWARPATSSSGGSNSGSGTFSVPKLGSIVRITFDNGNYYSPIYHNAIYSSDELKEEIQNSYQNSHILIYDTAFGLNLDRDTTNNERGGESIKIFFTEEKGLVFDYNTVVGPTKINIKPDNSVEIVNANGDSIIMLNDGNITFTHSAKFIINSTDNTEINCNNAIIKCNTADITASTKAIIDSPNIELGRSAVESVIKGDTFSAIFDNHIHPTPSGPSSKPIQSMKPSLSKITKTL